MIRRIEGGADIVCGWRKDARRLADAPAAVRAANN